MERKGGGVCVGAGGLQVFFSSHSDLIFFLNDRYKIRQGSSLFSCCNGLSAIVEGSISLLAGP